MRKKTIKSYFFNPILHNPSVHYLFCFSKRAFRQNKNLIAYKKKLRSMSNKKQIHDFKYNIKNYKILLNKKIKKNQWAINNSRIHLKFLNSFFFNFKFYRSRFTKKNTINAQLFLWFLLKQRTQRFFYIYLKKYTITGILSSHFVHILSRKNLSYQGWSKYRSKLFGLHPLNKQLVYYTKYTTLYNWILLTYLYSCTDTLSERHSFYDDEFNYKQTTNIQNVLTNRHPITTQHYKLNFNQIFSSINSHVSAIDINLLNQNTGLIESYISEVDKIKKDALKENLLTLGLLNDYVTSRYFSTPLNTNCIKTPYNIVYLYIINYKNLY